jgi:ABC-type transporter Mla subunit MlaD
VRVLKEQINELTDAGKSKDSALKRTLQKLEYVTEDLDKANNQLEAINDTKQNLEETKG